MVHEKRIEQKKEMRFEMKEKSKKKETGKGR